MKDRGSASFPLESIVGAGLSETIRQLGEEFIDGRWLQHGADCRSHILD